jgi:hypothetical protein
MTEHTPGPWSLPHFAEPDVNCACEYVLCDHLMGAVASVHCSGEGDDWQKGGDNPKFAEAVANARLIAAAPDMLAALLAARPLMIPGMNWTDAVGEMVRDMIDAAIAKATTHSSA